MSENMCGICGTAQIKPAISYIREMLKRLEYRGYDSAGAATVYNSKLFVEKDGAHPPNFKIEQIREKLNSTNLPGNIGIGHTRWATHGEPNKINAHPHTDCNSQLALVHNGVIDNYLRQREEVVSRGHKLLSRTDTEILPHLIEEFLETESTLFDATKEALKQIEGTYATAVIYAKEPDRIVLGKKGSPLHIGLGYDGLYCASDIPALLPFITDRTTNLSRIISLEDNQIAEIITDGKYRIETLNGDAVKPQIETLDIKPENVEKGGFPHFILKEIYEQPESLARALHLQEAFLKKMVSYINTSKEVFLIACGTSYNACLAGSYIFNSICNDDKKKILATPVIASEFSKQYGKSIDKNTVILAISQSGETADTLDAVQCGLRNDAIVLGLTNNIASSLRKITEKYAFICQQSLPEIGVAATKTYTSQLTILDQLALQLAEDRGILDASELTSYRKELNSIPKIAESVIKEKDNFTKNLARNYRKRKCFYFMGTGVHTATAEEGRLKLLELASIPCLSYPSGEAMHGPISVIEKGFPVVATVPYDNTRNEMIGDVEKMRARGAHIIVLAYEGDKEMQEVVGKGNFIGLPNLSYLAAPIAYILPLQLFAYHFAVLTGKDVDKPNNLAKSVTVR